MDMILVLVYVLATLAGVTTVVIMFMIARVIINTDCKQCNSPRKIKSYVENIKYTDDVNIISLLGKLSLFLFVVVFAILFARALIL